MNAEARGLTFAAQALSERKVHAARILAFVVFTSIGAQLAVKLPFTPVPITMQTLFVVLAGITLGPRDAFLAMASYLALGASGVPVFAGFSFGAAAIIGPTGGYLLAFPFAAMLSAAVYEGSHRSGASILLAAFSGSALILAFGTLHVSLVLGTSLARAVTLGALPFVAGEIVKAFCALAIAGRR